MNGKSAQGDPSVGTTIGLMLVCVFLIGADRALAQSPSRVIELPVWQDPDQWARTHQLAAWSVREEGMSRRFLISRISDERWRDLQAVCSGEVRCYTDSCQQVRSRSVQTYRLVPAPPELTASLAGEPHRCDMLDRSRMTEQLQEQPQCWLQQQGEGCEATLTAAQLPMPSPGVQVVEAGHCADERGSSPCQAGMEVGQ